MTITAEKIEQAVTTLEERVTDLSATLERERIEHREEEARMKMRACQLARDHSIGSKFDRMLSDLGWGSRPVAGVVRYRVDWEQGIQNIYNVMLDTNASQRPAVYHSGYERGYGCAIRWTNDVGLTELVEVGEDGVAHCPCERDEEGNVRSFTLADAPEKLRTRLRDYYGGVVMDAPNLTASITVTSCDFGDHNR